MSDVFNQGEDKCLTEQWRPLLDFIDAGANDDEPVKGITQGDIRAWYDEYHLALDTIEMWKSETERRRAALVADESGKP